MVLFFLNTDDTDLRDYLAYAHDFASVRSRISVVIFSEHKKHEKNEKLSFILCISWSNTDSLISVVLFFLNTDDTDLRDCFAYARD